MPGAYHPFFCTDLLKKGRRQNKKNPGQEGELQKGSAVSRHTPQTLWGHVLLLWLESRVRPVGSKVMPKRF
jgi:hypothetical protein